MMIAEMRSDAFYVVKVHCISCLVFIKTGVIYLDIIA
jgi:hypothetical protein